jgi:glycosyltransferase involved in cell wall biosynthesis
MPSIQRTSQPVNMASASSPAEVIGPARSTRDEPAVSIIVPCYNGGRFLDGLMAALDRQIFRDFEIIIIDDGSTDELTARKLAELKDRARVIRQPNRGLPAARNAGAQAARADTVFFHDCDDTIEPTYLSEIFPALESAPPDVAMAFSHMRLVGGDSGAYPRYFNRFDLLFGNIVGTGLLVRMECWRAVGGYDETMRDGYEDWDFSLRLVEACYRGIEIAKPLFNYRVAPVDQAPSMMSVIHTQGLYAKLWRQLRERHPQSYNLPAIIKAWWTTRHESGRIPLWKGLGGYMLAVALPDAAFNRLFVKFHRYQLRKSARAFQT